VIRKNIVMMGAIALRSPSRTPPCAMSTVMTIARRGSSLRPLPVPKNARRRKTSSRASACRMRGAPIMDPSAELSVAAKTPRTMRSGTSEVSRTTKLFVVNV
jgi:hypothetical protein